MASIIRIKRSGSVGAPTSGLAQGEMAYSWLSDKLYIGTGTETNGVAANTEVIGGLYYTDLIDASVAGTLTTNQSSIPILSATGTINQWLVGNLELTGNTLSSTNTNGDINITSDGTGKVVLTNPYIGSDSLEEYIYDTVGGAVTAGTGITVTNDDVGNSSTISITDTGVAAATYGSATQIPVLAINAQGQVTTASTASISTTLSTAAETGTGSVNLLGGTLTFQAGEGIDTNASGDVITIAGEDASTTNKGIASFATANFTVTSGAVSTKDITLGTSTLTNGSTTLTLAGLQALTVDNLTIDGNTISADAANNGITLDPNGGHVSVNSSRIEDVAYPVQATDAANKQYVDDRAAGLDPKQSVRVATTGNINLTSDLENGDTIDGVTLVTGDRVLVKDQSTASENGVYVVVASGAASRATDMDEDDEVTAGLFFFVEEGSSHADSGWVLTSDNPLTVDTDDLVFTQFSGAGQVTAGDGLSKAGNVINVNVATSGGIEIVSDELQLKSSLAGAGLTYSNGVLDVVGTTNRITVNANDIDIASTYVGQTSITTLGTITTGTWNANVIQDAYIADNLTISGGTVDNTPIGASQRSSGAFTTLTANGAVTFTAGTASTNTTSGTLVVTGGIGMSGTMYVGNDLIGAGASTSNLDGFNIDGGTY